MNDYFLTILISERQHQLLKDARPFHWQPARRPTGLFKRKTAIGALIRTQLFARCFTGNITAGGWGRRE